MLLCTSTGPWKVPPWWYVYCLIPGGNAIRMVLRIDLTIYFFLTLALVIGLDRLLKGFSSDSTRNTFGDRPPPPLLNGEQWVKGLPSFDTRPWEQEVSEMRDLLSNGGDVGYVA